MEYVYRTTSMLYVPDTVVARMMGYGQNLRDKKKEKKKKRERENELADMGVTWLHRKTWSHASPSFPPNLPMLDNIEIAPDLFDTAAADDVVSSMGCQSGLILRIIYIKQKARGKFTMHTAVSGLEEDRSSFTTSMLLLIHQIRNNTRVHRFFANTHFPHPSSEEVKFHGFPGSAIMPE